MRTLRHGSRGILLALSLAALTACGGGSGGGGGGGSGGSNPPPVSTQPTAQDQANAKAAVMSANLNMSTGLATLSWTDTFPSISGYDIQQQTDGTTWTTIDTVPGQGGSKTAITWSGAVSVTETLRVQAVETNYSVPLLTQSGQQQVQIAYPPTSPTIQLNESEPVSGQVQISVSNATGYSSVTYFVDLATLRTSTTGPNFPVNWDTTTLTNGQHLLVAMLQVNPDYSVQVRRSVQLANAAVAVSISPSGGTIPGGATLTVTATSDAGIQSVTLSMDGNPVGTLTAPNGGGNNYSFQINGSSGQHVFQAQAIDNNGQSSTATATITLSNPPQLSLSSPVDGGLINGTLHIAGTATSDKPGAVTTTATLGNVPVLNTTVTNFSTDFSLTGVVPGDYTLTVVSTDSTGSTLSQSLIVTVTSSPALVYAPVVTIGGYGDLLATDPATVLYRSPDGSVHLLSGSSNIVLVQGSSSGSGGYTQWMLSAGNAFALDAVTLDSVHYQKDIIYWNAGGTRTDLGSLGAVNDNYIANLEMVHWPWALGSYWTVPAGQATGNTTLTFFNAQTGQTLSPPLPEVSGSAGTVDFFAAPAGLNLYYMTDLSQNGGFNPVGIDRWNQGTNQVIPLATGNLWQLSPQTDGIRVAWQSGALGVESGPYSLVSYDIASSTPATLSTTMSQFQLADGILAWVESGSNTTLIKASDGTTVTTVSALTSSHFYGTGGGYVLFGEASKLYVWSAAAGRQLLFDAVPNTARISGKAVYFTNGTQQLLYAVTLN